MRHTITEQEEEELKMAELSEERPCELVSFKHLYGEINSCYSWEKIGRELKVSSMVVKEKWTSAQD